MYFLKNNSFFIAGEELKKSLISEARKRSKLEKFFCVNRPIDFAPVQIAHQLELDSAEIQGHYHHREEISHSVIDTPAGTISIKDMFAEANDHAQNLTSKNQYSSEEERKKDTDLLGNVIGMIGQAGIGKTTLSKRILKQVVDEGLFDAEFIFYMQFREVDYTKDINLLSFLAKPLSLQWGNDKQRRDAVLRKVSESNAVVLIMDGLDEAFIDFSHSFPITNLFDDAKPETFVKNIMRGNILSNAKKLVTSRPRTLLEIPSELRPNYIVRIMGLDLKAQSQICKSICDENSESVFDFIQQQPPIASYCYVPANCILVMHSIHSIKTVQPKEKSSASMPNTITGILTVVLCLFVASPHARDARSKFPLQKLASLAWETFKNKKIRFEEADLQNAGLTIEELNFFLVTTLEKDSLSLFGGDSTKVFYFAHLLIHEFFVAVHLVFFTSEKEFKQLVTGRVLGGLQLSKPLVDLTEGKWEMVTKFLFGICNIATLTILKDQFPNLCPNVAEKAKILREFALRKIPDRSSENYHYFQNVLRVCYWTYELNDDKFSVLVASRVKEDVDIRGTIIPSDVAPFSYVLRQRKSRINIGTTRLESLYLGNSLQQFLKELKQTSTATPVKVIRNNSNTSTAFMTHDTSVTMHFGS